MVFVRQGISNVISLMEYGGSRYEEARRLVMQEPYFDEVQVYMEQGARLWQDNIPPADEKKVMEADEKHAQPVLSDSKSMGWCPRLTYGRVQGITETVSATDPAAALHLCTPAEWRSGYQHAKVSSSTAADSLICLVDLRDHFMVSVPLYVVFEGSADSQLNRWLQTVVQMLDGCYSRLPARSCAVCGLQDSPLGPVKVLPTLLIINSVIGKQHFEAAVFRHLFDTVFGGVTELTHPVSVLNPCVESGTSRSLTACLIEFAPTVAVRSGLTALEAHLRHHAADGPFLYGSPAATWRDLELFKTVGPGFTIDNALVRSQARITTFPYAHAGAPSNALAPTSAVSASSRFDAFTKWFRHMQASMGHELA